jgi:NAD(P)H-binding
MPVEMTTQSSHASPILVTGAAGAVGSLGRNLTEMLLAKGHKVRALVRREDGRAEALRQLGAEVIQGDLTDLTAMHRSIDGCKRIYFGMSVSPQRHISRMITSCRFDRIHSGILRTSTGDTGTCTRPPYVIAESAVHQRQSCHSPDQRQRTGRGESGIKAAGCSNDIPGYDWRQ